MKSINIIFLLSLTCLLFMMTGCKDEEPSVYSGGDNFHFLSETSSIDESSVNPIEIPVIFTKMAAKSGSVSFSITSENAVENVDYVVANTSSTFDFGNDAYTESIFIQPLNDDILTGNKVILITLEGASESVGFPGPDALNSTHTFTIVEDDCAVPLVGTFTEVSDGGYGDGSGAIGTPIAEFPWGALLTVEKVSCDGDGKYVIDDITMGMYVGAYGAASGVPATFINNGESITIIEEESPDIVYPGDAFFGSGSVTDDDTFVLSWANGYGDQGNSTLSRQ